MSCCQCQGIETQFNRKSVAKELERYRQKGPNKATRTLINALKAEGIKGMVLLDIGGGVGAIQHELLKAGVSKAINVEASTAYIEAAKEEAERQGHGDRLSHYHGDFVNLTQDLPQADIITLDRVICCYQNMQALVRLSSTLTSKLYGVVYPQDTMWMKISTAFSNFIYWIRRNPFRLFVHPTEMVEKVIRDNGLERRFYRKVGISQVVVYACTKV